MLQTYREMVNRTHELRQFDLPNGLQVLMADDAYDMLVELLADVMLEENEGQGLFWRPQGLSG